MGAFHNEVFKFAADMIKIDQIDRNIIAVNDFNDGAQGEKFHMEYTQNEFINLQSEMKTDTILFEESIKEESVLHEISICPLEDCFQECSSKEDYTLHLYQEHYKDLVYYDLKEELEIEVDSSRCPCARRSSSNGVEVTQSW